MEQIIPVNFTIKLVLIYGANLTETGAKVMEIFSGFMEQISCDSYQFDRNSYHIYPNL
jgi:hypothetical protein